MSLYFTELSDPTVNSNECCITRAMLKTQIISFPVIWDL